ncbi:MAG: hypothetical protein IIW88_00835 [Clostridia bacterium]|nr:hypothetical protein [Clostridia bacterium]
MDERQQIKNQLVNKLKTISEDREFILSVINSARHTDDRKTVIEYIDNGEDVSYENVILLALTLYEEREKIK